MYEHIWMYTSKNAFNEFNNVVYEDVKVIITKYNTVSKWLAYILKYYYDRNVRLDNFLAIDKTHFITWRYIFRLIGATADDIKHFAFFMDGIIFNRTPKRRKVIELHFL